MLIFSLVIIPGILIAKPGPGNGCLEIISLFKLSSKPKLLTSSLNKNLRGSTNLASTARPGFAHIGDSTSGDQRTYQMLMISMQFLDSPSSTSQITYSVGISMDTGTGYFNRNRNNDSGSKGTSIITVMEIAG